MIIALAVAYPKHQKAILSSSGV
jgi:hypothetical protein